MHEITTYFSWETPEYIYKKSTNDWYWGIAIVGIIGTVAGILMRNYLLAVVTLLAAVLLFVYSKRKPEHIFIEISEQGIKINDTMYQFQNLGAFWITRDEHGLYKILATSNRPLIPLLSFHIDETIDIESLRAFLLEYLEETELEEPLLDKWVDKMGY